MVSGWYTALVDEAVVADAVDYKPDDASITATFGNKRGRFPRCQFSYSDYEIRGFSLSVTR